MRELAEELLELLGELRELRKLGLLGADGRLSLVTGRRRSVSRRRGREAC
jgi:hypothetical protein